jgi:hypothetical protein
MDGKIVVYIIFLFVIMGGVMGIFYTTDVDEAQKEFILAQQQVGQIEDAVKKEQVSLAHRKEAAAIITAAHIIERENNQLREETRKIKDNRDNLAKAFTSTIQRVREESIGMIIPEIPLATGNTLKNAKIQAVDENLTVIQHSEGVSKIPTTTLPASLLDRFRFGYVPGGVGTVTTEEIEIKESETPRKDPKTSMNFTPPSTANMRTSASDSLVRLGEGGPAEVIKKNSINKSRPDARLSATEGDPALWKSVQRHSIGRAYVPGQGWLKIGPRGPIPGSGRN